MSRIKQSQKWSSKESKDNQWNGKDQNDTRNSNIIDKVQKKSKASKPRQ